MSYGLTYGYSDVANRAGAEFGPELVVNGSFETTIDPWTSARPTNGTVERIEELGIPYGRATSTTADQAFGITSNAITAEVGATYLVSGEYYPVTHTALSILRFVPTNDLTGSNLLVVTPGLTFSVEAEATATTMYVGVIAVPDGLGNFFHITNFSVKKVL
jgi:hypothetical protein